MKKKLLSLLSILILTSAVSVAFAKTNVSSELAGAIKLYKAGNYSQCYTTLESVIRKDNSNALAYYYLAITSVQLGRKDDAIANYDKAIALATPGGNISAYATKGKICLEEPDKCSEAVFQDEYEEFIKTRNFNGLSDKVRSDYERLKIENMMREINRHDDIAPQKFKEFKDFSSMNNTEDAVPTNDEIVAALRTLQRAGLTNILNNNYGQDFSMLMDSQNDSRAILNMLGSKNLSPEVIQSMLTNSMSLGF
ncbi:MAG: tetratricopeptide repeat protein [bacterium]|nr:tetratricopeptide repeat protein [bacterium]